jgi:fructosamine-3-kinase
MNIDELVKELKNKKILNQEIASIELLTGGTTSKLYLLKIVDGTKVVVKFNESQVIQAEGTFLEFYKELSLLPKVLYIEENHSYLVYTYLEGFTHNLGMNKVDILKNVAESLISQYRVETSFEGWGWIDEPSHSWNDFLLKRVEESEKIINQVLTQDDNLLVKQLITRNSGEDRLAYILHGDCGLHNFLFAEDALCGVIDPTPIVGDPFYDLVYAFCSTPEDLSKETIYTAAHHLKGSIDAQRLDEKVLIGLYLRIESCMKHHPNDLPQYLTAWGYWKDIVLKNHTVF